MSRQTRSPGRSGRRRAYPGAPHTTGRAGQHPAVRVASSESAVRVGKPLQALVGPVGVRQGAGKDRGVGDAPVALLGVGPFAGLALSGSCLVSLSGLQAGTQYSVFIDTQAVPNESASAILNGPWTPLGMFDASSDGTGTYTCTQRPPSGSILAINPQPQDESILFSGQLP